MPGLNPVVYRDKPLAGDPLDFTFWLSPAAAGAPPLIRGIRALPSSSDWQLPWHRPQRGWPGAPPWLSSVAVKAPPSIMFQLLLVGCWWVGCSGLCLLLGPMVVGALPPAGGSLPPHPG